LLAFALLIILEYVFLLTQSALCIIFKIYVATLFLATSHLIEEDHLRNVYSIPKFIELNFKISKIFLYSFLFYTSSKDHYLTGILGIFWMWVKASEEASSIWAMIRNNYFAKVSHSRVFIDIRSIVICIFKTFVS
jgi:hypothetical protein